MVRTINFEGSRGTFGYCGNGYGHGYGSYCDSGNGYGHGW
jgi:hypothetical protein